MNVEIFQHRVLEALAPHGDALVSVLRHLVRHTYPREVESLAFEVFPDGFTQGFPVRAFFLDANNTEFFVYENGEARYPSPVDLGLLNLERVYSHELEREIEAAVPDADYFTLAGEAFVAWFAKCWVNAGGLDRDLAANIRLHDDLRFYDLRSQRWRDE
jgi:hypothetical protein